jgi:hypothetical protein
LGKSKDSPSSRISGNASRQPGRACNSGTHKPWVKNAWQVSFLDKEMGKTGDIKVSIAALAKPL